MAEEPRDSVNASAEQLAYAAVLEWGARAGLLCLVVGYAVYLSPWLEARIPPAELALHWGKCTEEFIRDTGAPNGWAWVRLLGHSDYLAFAGIALLAGVTLVCYLVLVLLLARSREWVHCILVLAQIAVLAVATSGVLVAGH